jgi:hypothetical protein
MTTKNVTCQQCGALAEVTVSGSTETHSAVAGEFSKCIKHQEAVENEAPLPARCDFWRKSVEDAFRDAS